MTPGAGLLTYFIPCYMVGKTAEAVGENCCIHCLVQLIPYLNWYCLAVLRGKVRENKGIGVSKCYRWRLKDFTPVLFV